MKKVLVSLWLIFPFVLMAQSEREVSVVQWSAFEDNGYIKVLGEVKNTYQNDMGFVRIEIEYFDKSGKPFGVERFTARDAGTMAKDETSASIDVIRPNETAPFERVRDVGKLKGQFGSCKIKAFGMLFKENVPAAASISNLQTQKQNNGFLVKGTYTAKGRQACKNPAVVIAGYDARGKIVKIDRVEFNVGNDRYNFVKSLSPNETYNFSANFIANSDVKQVKVFPYFGVDF